MKIIGHTVIKGCSYQSNLFERRFPQNFVGYLDILYSDISFRLTYH